MRPGCLRVTLFIALPDGPPVPITYSVTPKEAETAAPPESPASSPDRPAQHAPHHGDSDSIPPGNRSSPNAAPPAPHRPRHAHHARRSAPYAVQVSDAPAIPDRDTPSPTDSR